MPYKRKGIYWFRWMLDATDDDAVDELLASGGPAAYGIMVQVFSELHAYGNRCAGNPPIEYVVRRVAHDLYAKEPEVMDTCEMMAALGLLDAELWAEGKVANEHTSADIMEYWAKVAGGKIGASERWKTENTQVDGISQPMPVQR